VDRIRYRFDLVLIFGIEFDFLSIPIRHRYR